MNSVYTFNPFTKCSEEQELHYQMNYMTWIFILKDWKIQKFEGGKMLKDGWYVPVFNYIYKGEQG